MLFEAYILSAGNNLLQQTVTVSTIINHIPLYVKFHYNVVKKENLIRGFTSFGSSGYLMQ
jgi:hypothetical protein